MTERAFLQGQEDRRGGLMIMQQWMITVGILVSYVIAVVILKVAPGSGDGPPPGSVPPSATGG